MITYGSLLALLNENADEKYRIFHSRLLKNDSIRLIGVRVPTLRKLAKTLRSERDKLFSFPDEYYEVTFLKCAVAGELPYEEFVGVVDSLVPLLDNWATCDCFLAPCVKSHREEFLPYIRRYLSDGKEFTVRFGLVTLLHYYVDERFLPVLFAAIAECDSDKYYITMAAAWLLAEILARKYDAGVWFLRQRLVKREVLTMGIRKACESFRLTSEQKDFLRALAKEISP